MIEPGYWNEDFDTQRRNANPAAAWHEYLHTKQGRVSLRFNRGEDFRSRAFAQRVGRFQIVEFAHAPLDYRRSRRDVNDDGDGSYRLVIPLKGRFYASQRSAEEELREGSAAFFRWGDPLSLIHDEPITALIMTVPEELIDPDRAAGAPLLLDRRRGLVRTLIAHVRELNEAREGWTAEDFRAAYSSALQELDWALAPPGPITSDDPKSVEYVRRLMKENANDLNVTPESIARLCGVTERTLRNWLKKEGLSPGQMLRDIRLDHAHHRLAQSVDLGTIASQAGYSTTRRFIDAHKRRYGVTPTELRHKLAADAAASVSTRQSSSDDE
ncbi:helix-turn-helix transcriptional regulator [Nocardia carnea]|uniref:helix-turn-helix transcriptional regulator n=1 Tax=Nocardia carnea TaxID=37328 RepID=UPI0024581DAA|nr:AraC family transcriptional regulator [Nocardia carnea]